MPASILLTELPLRPSSLQKFTKRGFQSTDEIEESRVNGGINLLASELDVSLQEAAGLIREIQGCLSTFDGAGAGGGGCGERDGVNNDDENTCDVQGDIDGIPINPISPVASHKIHDNQQLQSTYDDGIVTAYDLLHMDNTHPDHPHHVCGFSSNRHVVTFCKAVDKLLGGGISLGQVTEISGLPGTGKTQLATQLSVLARLPREFGGVEGKALYIDAEGSFVPERAHAMANALRHHVHATARRRRRRHNLKNDQHQHRADALSPRFTVEDILDSIDVFRVHDETALLATLYSLRTYVEKSQREFEQERYEKHQGRCNSTSNGKDNSSASSLPVRLIVIDSIAFHFRAVTPTDSSYYVQRTKTLTSLAAYLGDLASKHDIAILVINQMTTKVNNHSNSYSNSSSSSKHVPALGESWGHATATRMILSNEEQYVGYNNIDTGSDSGSSNPNDAEYYQRGSNPSFRQVRACSLIKSAHRPAGTASFRILETGIRDVEEESKAFGRDTGSSGVNNNNKRLRPL